MPDTKSDSVPTAPSPFAPFRNRHRGERCVIMGNGPSLNRTDLDLLRAVPTFGMNKIFLLLPRLGWAPTYHVAVNPLVIEQCREDILASSMPKFIGHEGRRMLPEREDILFLTSNRREPGFTTDLDQPLWQGHTVTYCAMQVAYHMGFSEVLLVGVDHSYQCSGQPNEKVTARGPDPNHFHPDYFSGGQSWQLPDLERSEAAYRLARQAFEADGRRILDATVGGRLTVFDKVRLEDALGR
ncbi:MAG: 6-hydroxymethylpterin diphosphokinase MptE-like protein [Desulfovibrionaceae bacterium]